VRIGAILPHLFVFGGVRRYIELGNAFVSRGHAFTIYTPRADYPRWLRFDGELRPLDEIGSDRSDVILCGSPELTAELDRSAAHVKIFYLQIEDVAREAEIVRSGRYHVMVNSSGLARRVRRRYGIEPLDGIGAVNPRIFHPAERRVRDGTFRVLCYGRLSRPRKGTRFVVRALRSMRQRGYPVELHLFDTINPGDDDPRIGFDPGVPFCFYLNLPQSCMAAMYGAADVFVSAEHRSGWNNTAAEAAACGLPLVCTRSGTEDFAEHGTNALIVPFRGALPIRRALIALCRDRERAARLGDEAHRRIMRFTWDALCAKMERTFLRITGGDAEGRAGGDRS
jgi:glycosyltransferase involved in cell wall biosynthesis